MLSKHKGVGAAEVLHTLELYFELQNSTLVGQKLGITAPAVLKRLTPFGVVPRPVGNLSVRLEDVNDNHHIAALKRYLRKKAEWEKQNPFAVRRSEAVPAIELLSTVALYFQLNSSKLVAEHMHINSKTVLMRLRGLKINLPPVGKNGIRPRDCNDMNKVQEIMKRLWDEAQMDIYLAQ
jgi:hypothetical protein